MAHEQAITETYKDMERLIYQTVARFVKRYGGDFEEFLAEANVAFMNVYKKYDRERGRFTTILVFAIRNRLINLRKRAIRKQNACRVVSLDTGMDDTRSVAGDVIDTRPAPKEYAKDWELSEEASVVVRLILNAPEGIRSMICKRSEKRSWQRALSNYLMGMGWLEQDIKRSFQEIKAVMGA